MLLVPVMNQTLFAATRYLDVPVTKYLVPHKLENTCCCHREKIRRLIDMVTVSVLLDAGAGATWSYHGPDGKMHGRSEGGWATAYFRDCCISY